MHIFKNDTMLKIINVYIVYLMQNAEWKYRVYESFQSCIRMT